MVPPIGCARANALRALAKFAKLIKRRVELGSHRDIGRTHCLTGNGAAYRIRTYDPVITNDVLYQLS